MSRRLGLLAAVLLAAPVAPAGTIEASAVRAARAFLNANALVVHPSLADSPEIKNPLQPPLKPRPISLIQPLGRELARVSLPDQLDKHRVIVTRRLGVRDMAIGAAADRSLTRYYLTFAAGDRLAIAPIGDLRRLVNPGAVVRIDETATYMVRIAINTFSPFYGSTFTMMPLSGTRGPTHEMTTGALINAARARAAIFPAGGKEFWLYYGTDVDAGPVLGKTRSFLFVHEQGFSSMMWPLAESALLPATPSIVTLGDVRVSLTLAPGQELVVNEVR